jgi:hypothetical protein
VEGNGPHAAAKAATTEVIEIDLLRPSDHDITGT